MALVGRKVLEKNRREIEKDHELAGERTLKK